MKRLYLLTTVLSLVMSVVAQSRGKDFDWGNATVYFVITDRFCNGDSTNDVNLSLIHISEPTRPY